MQVMQKGIVDNMLSRALGSDREMKARRASGRPKPDCVISVEFVKKTEHQAVQAI